MKLVRSWPANPPPHPHVVDGALRNVNDDYDYSGLADFDDDLVHLDWDTAVHREDLADFAQRCRSDPGRVRVAPCVVYGDSRRSDARSDRGRTQWNLRRYVNDRQATRICTTEDDSCHLFGFGMVYLPQTVIAQAAERFRPSLDDITFAQWHHLNITEEVPIEWDIRPVHVHYRIEDVIQ